MNQVNNFKTLNTLKMKKSFSKTTLSILSLTSFILFALSACKPKCERHPDDAECVGEEEVITSLKINFKDSATGAMLYTYQFRDVDNNGMPEQFDTIKLQANKTYKAELQFLNEAATPAQDVTAEIEKEKNDHLVVFEAHNLALTFSYIDYDNNNLPVGLQTYWRTGADGTGHAKVTLRHQPEVKNGTPAPGDTDMEVEFNTVIQ